MPKSSLHILRSILWKNNSIAREHRIEIQPVSLLTQEQVHYSTPMVLLLEGFSIIVARGQFVLV